MLNYLKNWWTWGELNPFEAFSIDFLTSCFQIKLSETSKQSSISSISQVISKKPFFTTGDATVMHKGAA